MTDTEIAVMPGEQATPAPTEDAGARRPQHERQRSKGTTFETLAVCGFIFGLFAMVAAVFAVGMAAHTADGADASGSLEEMPVPPGDPAAGTSTAEVSLGEFFIDPDDARISAGAVLDITNEGDIQHNLAVDGIASEVLDPGQSGTLDLSELEPGSYRMICEIPGHEEAGMKGTLVIG